MYVGVCIVDEWGMGLFVDSGFSEISIVVKGGGHLTRQNKLLF
jgi:hypothetical protein